VGGVWRRANTLFNEGVIGDVADEQLLERFVAAPREVGEVAFEALVERHGPMVLRICRTILRDEHDAEDAFQATFLVLARQAASIRRRASVASWLHGVARRVASSARSAASRRRQHQRKAADLVEPFVVEPRWDDLAQVVHEEIDQLPERFRGPIVLCDMEGLTEGQAARRLGRPVGTIRSELSRARQSLRGQLTRRGLAPASVVLVVAHAGRPANAVVANALVSSTVQSAVPFAVMRMTTGIVPASAAALADNYLRIMLMARIKNVVMAALVAIGIAAAGVFALEPLNQKAASASDAKHELLDLMHAWGKAVVQSDVGLMDRLLAYEMVCTDPGGAVWNKSQYLEFVRTGFWHVASYELKDTRVQVYGDAAVVTGLFLTNVNTNASQQFVERSTSTWIRRHGTWQCVASQTMIISNQQKPHARRPPSGSATAPPPAPVIGEPAPAAPIGPQPRATALPSAPVSDGDSPSSPISPVPAQPR
jgi:RNA polymerase sigma factor (sigma-70 family)